jgi:hypothetical protein
MRNLQPLADAHSDSNEMEMTFIFPPRSTRLA